MNYDLKLIHFKKIISQTVTPHATEVWKIIFNCVKQPKIFAVMLAFTSCKGVPFRLQRYIF